MKRAQDTNKGCVRFGQQLHAKSRILVVHPPLHPYNSAPTTARLAVMSSPCCCHATRGSVGTFCSVWSALWACWLCCTKTDRYGLSFTQTNTHVCCVALELVCRPPGEKWSSWPFCYIFEIEKMVILKDNLAKGCILHL